MDTTQWPQDIGLMASSSSASASINNSNVVVGSMGRPQQQQLISSERRTRPQKEQALNCPRCNSTNTKFCYYNNYSLTQPRYFCKACRRYWTEGGSLRNVPVGGGSRKNRRPSSSSSSASSAAGTPSTTTTASAATTSISLPTVASASYKNQNPKFQEGQDLNLAFTIPEFGDYHHFTGFENTSSACTNTTTNTSGALSAMEMLRSTEGIRGSGLNPFMQMHPMPMPNYPSSGFGDFRSNSLSFPLDAGMSGSAGGGYGGGGLQEGSGRLLFPFEETTRPVSSGSGSGSGGGCGDQSGGDPPGFWNGMMGGRGGGGGGGGGGSW